MKKCISWLLATVLGFILGLGIFLYADRYRTALEWAEEGAFSKATPFLELPFITEIHDPGFVDYAFAGEMVEMCRYAEAIPLLIPLAERNYRNSAQLLTECIEKCG